MRRCGREVGRFIVKSTETRENISEDVDPELALNTSLTRTNTKFIEQREAIIVSILGSTKVQGSSGRMMRSVMCILRSYTPPQYSCIPHDADMTCMLTYSEPILVTYIYAWMVERTTTRTRLNIIHAPVRAHPRQLR